MSGNCGHKVFLFVLLLITLILCSCDNVLESLDSLRQEDGSAYLSISAGDTSRTVFPEQFTLASDMSLSFELKGGLVGGGQTVLRTWTAATSTSAYAAMTGDNSLTVEAGDWNFTLEAKRNNLVVLSATIDNMAIVAGANKLSFGIMKENRTSGTGTVDLTIKLPADSGVSSVGTGVLCIESGSLEDTRQELTLQTDGDGTPFFRYYRENVGAGSYSLMIQLAQDKEPDIKYVFRETVQVAANLTSSKTSSISSLSTVYSVTFDLDTTEGNGAWKDDSAPQDFYNPYDIFVLPTAGTIVPPQGYFFGGWYEDSNFSGSPVIMLGGGSSDTPTGAKTFYAKWTQELYVGGPAASDANGGGIAAAPLASIQAAVDKIVEANDGTSAYSILLMGNIDDTGRATYSDERNNSLVNIVSTQNLTLTIKSDSDGTSRTVNAGRTATNTGRVMYVGDKATVTIKDLVLTGGYADNGGGVYVYSDGSSSGNSGTLNMNGGSISGNTATNGGGGVYVSGGTLSMLAGEISNNTATSDGGGVYVDTAGIVSMDGGAIGVSGSPNTADNGGGIAVNGGMIYVTAGSVSYNTATTNGGGIYLLDGNVELKENGAVSNNRASSGGGVYVDSTGTFNANGGIIGGSSTKKNTGTNGGGVYNAGTLNIAGTIISYNEAEKGGGLYVDTVDTTSTMTAGEITNNTATPGGGGGVFINSGTFTMDGGKINQNRATTVAGGVYVGASAIFYMNSGEIKENTAPADGGGVYVAEDGTFEMDDGTISGNRTDGNGGGVFVAANSTFTATGGTIGGVGAGNSAKNGGGVYTASAGTDTSGTAGKLELKGAIISYNNAETSGGGVANYGTLEMSSGSIANNTASHNGGGVNNTGTLTMTGGSIGDNTATNAGGGIYQNGIFNMGGAAMVNLGNDVYLVTGKTITITSELTGLSVANIKLPSYGVGTQLLEAGSGVDLAAAAGKFMVNMDIDSGNSPYFVDSSGRLQNN